MNPSKKRRKRKGRISNRIHKRSNLKKKVKPHSIVSDRRIAVVKKSFVNKLLGEVREKKKIGNKRMVRGKNMSDDDLLRKNLLSKLRDKNMELKRLREANEKLLMKNYEMEQKSKKKENVSSIFPKISPREPKHAPTDLLLDSQEMKKSNQIYFSKIPSPTQSFNPQLPIDRDIFPEKKKEKSTKTFLSINERNKENYYKNLELSEGFFKFGQPGCGAPRKRARAKVNSANYRFPQNAEIKKKSHYLPAIESKSERKRLPDSKIDVTETPKRENKPSNSFKRFRFNLLSPEQKRDHLEKMKKQQQLREELALQLKLKKEKRERKFEKLKKLYGEEEAKELMEEEGYCSRKKKMRKGHIKRSCDNSNVLIENDDVISVKGSDNIVPKKSVPNNIVDAFTNGSGSEKFANVYVDVGNAIGGVEMELDSNLGGNAEIPANENDVKISGGNNQNEKKIARNIISEGGKKRKRNFMNFGKLVKRRGRSNNKGRKKKSVGKRFFEKIQLNPFEQFSPKVSSDKKKNKKKVLQFCEKKTNNDDVIEVNIEDSDNTDPPARNWKSEFLKLKRQFNEERSEMKELMKFIAKNLKEKNGKDVKKEEEEEEILYDKKKMKGKMKKMVKSPITISRVKSNSKKKKKMPVGKELEKSLDSSSYFISLGDIRGGKIMNVL